MTSKRRGASRSGRVAVQGDTPTGEVPPPGLTHAVAAMAAQIEAFAKEVKDLKAVLAEAAARNTQSVCGASTLDLDVAHFRRLRRLRLAALVGIPLMLCLAGAAMWTRGVRTPAPSRAPVHAQNPGHSAQASAPQSAPAAPTTPNPPAIDAPKAPPVEPHVIAAQARTKPTAARTTAATSVSRHAHAPAAVNVPPMTFRPTAVERGESSGGAPILD